MKEYNDLTDIQKKWYNEYHSWSKSNCPTAYKMEMLSYYYMLLASEGLAHLIKDKK